MCVWGGHSCPPLLNLIWACHWGVPVKSKSKSKAADKSVRPHVLIDDVVRIIQTGVTQIEQFRPIP